MIVSIQPSQIQGKLFAPASKSSMQRGCAAALLSKGTTTILNPGHSNDDEAALDVIARLGAKIEGKGTDRLVISSNGVQPVSNELNCGESGLGIRMFTPLAALSDRTLKISGTGSLLTRPMHFFDEIFPALGIEITSNKGFLPLTLKGPLKPANIEIDGSLSSQFLTGLLMAFAAANATDVAIRVKDLKSKPYIDLTLAVMRDFGVEVTHDNYQVFYFKGSTQGFIPHEYQVEGDWSGGSFLLVAGAVSGEIVVEGLDPASTQADKAILDALKSAGAKMEIKARIIKCGPGQLKPFRFDATDCPDLFPPLVALAAYCDGVSEIKGVSRLAHKESDRGITLQQEFGKMGISVELDQDIMRIIGGSGIRAAQVHSHHDHRIAMACAVAALGSDGETVIEEANAINKSYPDFFDHLKALGANLTLNNQTLNA